MKKERASKEEILRKGAEIIYFKGFYNTGINEILTAAGVPKGSFYYYFKSKEEFGLVITDVLLSRFITWADEYLSQAQASYIRCLENFFDRFLSFFKDNGFRGGCPIGNLSLELSDLSDALRQKLSLALDQMNDKVLLFLQKARENSEIEAGRDLESLATFILNSWEGALLRTKVSRDCSSLNLFNRMVFHGLLGTNSTEEDL